MGSPTSWKHNFLWECSLNIQQWKNPKWERKRKEKGGGGQREREEEEEEEEESRCWKHERLGFRIMLPILSSLTASCFHFGSICLLRGLPPRLKRQWNVKPVEGICVTPGVSLALHLGLGLLFQLPLENYELVENKSIWKMRQTFFFSFLFNLLILSFLSSFDAVLFLPVWSEYTLT